MARRLARAIYAMAEEVTGWLSWLMPVGLFPLASEAFGTRKPYVVWTIAAVTTIVSLWFMVLLYSGSPDAWSWERLALWGGR